MDDLDPLLHAARPDGDPDPAVVAAHRAQLRAAIAPPPEAAGDVVILTTRTPAASGGGGRGSARTVLAAAAAIVVVTVGAAILARTGGTTTTVADQPEAATTAAPADDDDPFGETATTPGPGTTEVTVMPSLPPTPGMACGGRLPLQVQVPEDFEGPVLSVDPGGVLHARWTRGEASLDLWWPGGDPAAPDAPATDDMVARTSYGQGGEEITLLRSTHLGEAPCDTVRAVLDGGGLDETLTIAGDVGIGPPLDAEPPALVVDRTVADAPPTVPPCHAPTGVEHDDVVGGTIDGVAPAGNPVGALEAALDATPRLPRGGYVEVRLPDGTVAYAATIELGVTVVTVVPTDAGWLPTRWDATGC